MTFDTEGIVRAFIFSSQQWAPVFDFKQRYSDIYANIWIVGVMDNEILAIVKPSEGMAPNLA
jgi:hypothetical protein